MRTLSLCLAAFGVLLLSSAGPRAAEAPALLDLAEMGLSVSRTEGVDKVDAGSGGKTTVLRAAEGRRLVVVTLAGEAPRACRVSTNATDFSALIGEGDSPTIERSAAVGLGTAPESVSWALPPQGATILRTWNVPRRMRLFVKVAFSLPAGVKTFSVRFPATAKGTAATD